MFPQLFKEFEPPLICSQVADPPTPEPGGGGSQTPPPPAPAPTPPAQVQDLSGEIARLNNTIADTRAEAAANRVDARTARESEAAAQARITELQAESTRREEAARAAGAQETNTWKGRAMDAELKAAALAAGLVDVDLLPLIKRDGITVAADGSITGIPEAIANFKSSKPTYFREGAPPAAPPTRVTGSPLPPPSPTPSSPASTVKDLETKDYTKRKQEASRSLRGL